MINLTSNYLTRNWLLLRGTHDHYFTYAFMILFGQNKWPFNDAYGTGPIQMLLHTGRSWWTKLEISHGMEMNFPIELRAGDKDFQVALWWPEDDSSEHNDIDLMLTSPSACLESDTIGCNVTKISRSEHTVFEHTRVDGPVEEGAWVITITGHNVPSSSPQDVYLAAHVKRLPEAGTTEGEAPE